LFLARFGSKVSIIHRRDQLRAGAYLTNRAMDNDKIEFVWDTVVEAINGENSVESLRIKNVKTGQASDLAVGGIFVYVGHQPNSEIFKGKLDMDDEGYLIADRRTHSNIDGIFIAGEAQDNYFRQAITTAGDGCKAAMEAEKFVARLDFQETAEPVVAETSALG
jgi:thioredoxin reductase (NADPH)